MIEYKIDKGREQLLAQGTLADNAAEVLRLIHLFHSRLARQTPGGAAAFRSAIVAGVMDPRSPVFKPDERPVNGIDIAIVTGPK